MSYAQGGYGHPATYGYGGQVHPPPPQGQHYQQQGGAPNIFSMSAAQALHYSSDDELFHIFESKKSQRYQGIQARHLKEILDKSPAMSHYYKITWSMELCQIMIAMLDRTKDGFMQYKEFQELLRCLGYWLQTFNEFDHDGSRYIEAHELGHCIKDKYKYALSQKAMEALFKRYSCAMEDGRVLIALDDFIALSVRLRAYTEAFRARDRLQHNGETGSATFEYDDFLQCVICL